MMNKCHIYLRQCLNGRVQIQFANMHFTTVPSRERLQCVPATTEHGRRKRAVPKCVGPNTEQPIFGDTAYKYGNVFVMYMVHSKPMPNNE